MCRCQLVFLEYLGKQEASSRLPKPLRHPHGYEKLGVLQKQAVDRRRLFETSLRTVVESISH